MGNLDITVLMSELHAAEHVAQRMLGEASDQHSLQTLPETTFYAYVVSLHGCGNVWKCVSIHKVGFCFIHAGWVHTRLPSMSYHHKLTQEEHVDSTMLGML